MGITCYMVRPTARCMYWHLVNNGAYLTDGNSVTPAQVNSIKSNKESANVRWPEIGPTGRRVLCWGNKFV
jgi:hypothetical protein